MHVDIEEKYANLAFRNTLTATLTSRDEKQN